MIKQKIHQHQLHLFFQVENEYLEIKIRLSIKPVNHLAVANNYLYNYYLKASVN